MSEEDAVQLTRRQLPGLALVPREPITRLRLPGTALDSIELPLAQARFTIGTGRCDVVVPRRVAPAVSAVHAVLERDGGGLVVRDLGSRNGTFASRVSARAAVLRVEPGDTFYLANVAVAVTDATLDVVRAHLLVYLGILATEAIEEAVRDVASGAPLLLVGPAGMGARRLARLLHEASPQRAGVRIVGLPPPCLLRHAQGATVYVDLDQPPRLTAPEAARLFDPASGVRLVFSARDERRAAQVLDRYRERVRIVRLVPLAARRDDVPCLMQLRWATALRTLHRVEDLGADAIAALVAHDWPGDLDELNDYAARILAYHVHGGLRPAAAALGIAHQTLAHHLARIGFPSIDPDTRDAPLHRARAARAATGGRDPGVSG